MGIFAKCKSVWSASAFKVGLSLFGLTVCVSPFVMSPEVFAPLFITGYEDKVFHVGFFAIAAVLFGRKRVLWPYLLLLVFGCFVEIIQACLPYRGFCTDDMLANNVGIILGGVLRFREVPIFIGTQYLQDRA